MYFPWIEGFWCCCSSKANRGRTWNMMVLVLWRLSMRATSLAALMTKLILGRYQVLWATLLEHCDKYDVLVEQLTARLTSGSIRDTDVTVISLDVWQG